jgi:RNA polymerase sigma-70 factor (ECF subfamily)
MDKPGAWVRRVVVNRSVSWFRRRGAERRALARLGNPGVAPGLDLDGQIAEVWAAVRSLPKRQAQVVALVHFDGMSIGEASDVMRCGRETARTHLKRGRKALAARLGVEEGHDA